MNAVLCIYLKLRFIIFVLNDLVHSGRTITLRRFIIFGQVNTNRDLAVSQFKVAGLFFFVVGVG